MKKKKLTNEYKKPLKNSKKLKNNHSKSIDSYVVVRAHLPTSNKHGLGQDPKPMP
jgi:hypothetical protein